jgi:uncharacterized damage-inducible protein DinB
LSIEIRNSQGEPSEAARIADQLRRVYEGPAWLGPALKPILSEITQNQAARRPIGNAHTIWELTLHIAAWMRIARERLAATHIRDDAEGENWPATEPQTFYELLHGVVQHTAYHAGQIVVLKK